MFLKIEFDNLLISFEYKFVQADYSKNQLEQDEVFIDECVDKRNIECFEHLDDETKDKIIDECYRVGHERYFQELKQNLKIEI